MGKKVETNARLGRVFPERTVTVPVSVLRGAREQIEAYIELRKDIDSLSGVSSEKTWDTLTPIYMAKDDMVYYAEGKVLKKSSYDFFYSEPKGE